MGMLRVCLDARLAIGSGGVEQTIIGLASGLSKLDDGEEEYLFLTYSDSNDWLKPYVGGRCRILPGPDAPARKQTLKARLGAALPRLRSFYHKLKPVVDEAVRLERSDATIEKARVDVMHFTLQTAFLTDVPSIYQPHDLQHLHLPQFFSARERTCREVYYRAFCEQARIVVVMSSWGKTDLIRHYGLPADKIHVIPWGPVLSAYPIPVEEDLCATRQKFNLKESFVLYPARTWPHKNHLGLLDGLAILRDEYHLRVPVVCTGTTDDFFPVVRKRMLDLHMQDQVRFLGFVSPLELQCLYRLSRGLVFPSRFEGWGMPVAEAFWIGTPAACSRIPPLADFAGNSAILFDPEQPREIADGLRRLSVDEGLRSVLVERGRERVKDVTWVAVARAFRARYRQLAGRSLSDEDRAAIAAPPLC